MTSILHHISFLCVTHAFVILQTISQNNLQVSFEDVKLVASQLGFKGKKGLVVEQRVTQKEDEEEDEVVMIEDEESSGGDGLVLGVVEEAMAVQGDEVEQYTGQSSREDNNIEQVKSTSRQEARKSPPGDNGNVRLTFGGNLPRANYGEQADAAVGRNGGDFTEQGNEVDQQSSRSQRLDEVPVSQVHFQDALEGGAHVRATSTPVAGSKSQTFPSENDASKISREVAIEQMDENGNQEGDANREERESFSASPLREDTQGGFVEASAVGEQDMDIDHSLMEKTRETPIALGSGDLGLRRSRSASPRSLKSTTMATMVGGPKDFGGTKGMFAVFFGEYLGDSFGPPTIFVLSPQIQFMVLPKSLFCPLKFRL